MHPIVPHLHILFSRGDSASPGAEGETEAYPCSHSSLGHTSCQVEVVWGLLAPWECIRGTGAICLVLSPPPEAIPFPNKGSLAGGVELSLFSSHLHAGPSLFQSGAGAPLWGPVRHVGAP